jgi:hypothetical protein
VENRSLNKKITMIVSTFHNNQPMTTDRFLKENSVLPERFRSISSPNSTPIVGEDLSSITKIEEKQSEIKGAETPTTTTIW